MRGLPLPLGLTVLCLSLVASSAHHLDHPVVDQFDARGVGVLNHAQQAMSIRESVELGLPQQPFVNRSRFWIGAAKTTALDEVSFNESWYIRRTLDILIAKRRLIEIVQDIPPRTLDERLVDLFAGLASEIELIAAQAKQHGLDDRLGISVGPLVHLSHEIDDQRRYAIGEYCLAGRFDSLDRALSRHRFQSQAVAQQRWDVLLPGLQIRQIVLSARKDYAVTERKQIESRPLRFRSVRGQLSRNAVLDQIGQTVAYPLSPLRIAAPMRKHLFELVEYEDRSQREVVPAPDLQRFAVEIFPQRLAVALRVFGTGAR